MSGPKIAADDPRIQTIKDYIVKEKRLLIRLYFIEVAGMPYKKSKTKDGMLQNQIYMTQYANLTRTFQNNMTPEERAVVVDGSAAAYYSEHYDEYDETDDDLRDICDEITGKHCTFQELADLLGVENPVIRNPRRVKKEEEK